MRDYRLDSKVNEKRVNHTSSNVPSRVYSRLKGDVVFGVWRRVATKPRAAAFL